MIYLCASYSRQAEMRQHRDELKSIGLKVRARWIDEPTKDDGRAHVDDVTAASIHAMNDIDDIRRCNMLIAFTQPPGTPYGRGGRHFEAGFFAGLMTLRLLDKKLIVVGPIENIFYAQQKFPKFATWEDLFAELQPK